MTARLPEFLESRI